MADSEPKADAGGKAPEAAKEAPKEAPKDAAKDAAKQEAANGTATPPPAASPPSAAFKEQFKAFSKFGDTKSDGKHITLSQSDKWMKQAKVIDPKSITTTDTGIHFKKFKLQKITLSDYVKFLDDLAKTRKVDVEQIKKKMAECGTPGVTSAVGKSKADAAVERLTDVTKYTGSHKQRFDESGKGRGIAGRKDVPDASGYVSGYKDKDTYAKTH